MCEFWLRSGQRSCVRIWGNRIVIYIGIAIGLTSHRNLALFWDIRGRLRPLRFAPSQANRNENKCWNNQLKDHTNSQELFVNSTVKSLFFIQGFYQVKVIQAGLTSWPLGMNFSLQVKELSHFHTWKMNTWKNLHRRMHRGYHPKPRQRGEFAPFRTSSRLSQLTQ